MKRLFCVSALHLLGMAFFVSDENCLLEYLLELRVGLRQEAGDLCAYVKVKLNSSMSE